MAGRARHAMWSLEQWGHLGVGVDRVDGGEDELLLQRRTPCDVALVFLQTRRRVVGDHAEAAAPVTPAARVSRAHTAPMRHARGRHAVCVCCMLYAVCCMRVLENQACGAVKPTITMRLQACMQRAGGGAAQATRGKAAKRHACRERRGGRGQTCRTPRGRRGRRSWSQWRCARPCAGCCP